MKKLTVTVDGPKGSGVTRIVNYLRNIAGESVVGIVDEIIDMGEVRDGRKPYETADIRQRIKEQSDLALFYAQDGAYHSAARVLLELADSVQEHAHRNTSITADDIAKVRYRRKSKSE